jgi:hypothetical protein
VTQPVVAVPLNGATRGLDDTPSAVPTESFASRHGIMSIPRVFQAVAIVGMGHVGLPTALDRLRPYAARSSPRASPRRARLSLPSSTRGLAQTMRLPAIVVDRRSSRGHAYGPFGFDCEWPKPLARRALSLLPQSPTGVTRINPVRQVRTAVSNP